MLRVLLAAAFLTFAGTQTVTQTPTEVDHAPYAGVREWVDGAHVPPIPNVPFIAKVIIETTRTLADGTNVTRKTINEIARDSMGRTRNEGRQLLPLTDNDEPKILRVIVNDPQAQTVSWIYPTQRLVRTYPLPAMSLRPSSTPSPALPTGVTLAKVDLGKQYAEGLELHGTRETRFYPAGLYGNDRAFEVVDEFWYSPDLQVNVIVRHNDPRTGISTVGLTEISRTEPDAKLFEIPSDYRRIQEPTSGGSANLQQGVIRPRRISGSEPAYTPAARKAKVQGSVLLSALIGVDGRVQDVSVVRSLRPDLDESSIDAVRSWRFQPATRNGTPVPFQVQIETSFRLY